MKLVNVLILTTILYNSLYASLIEEAEDEINVTKQRGRYKLNSDCSTQYIPYSNKEQIVNTSDCSNINDDNHWIEINNQAKMCTSSGTIGEEIPSATTILNPAPVPVLPTWEDGGKNTEYTYYDLNEDEQITTYEGYCSTEFAKNMDEKIVEGEANVQAGYQTYGPINGSIQTFEGTAKIKKADSCQGSTDDNPNWIIENNKGYICESSGNNTEITKSIDYFDNVPSTACIKRQKERYEIYKNGQEHPELNNPPRDCSQISNEPPTIPEEESSDNQIERISSNANEKLLKEKAKERMIEYMLPMGYRYIPKIKEKNVQAYRVHPSDRQSNYGVFGPVKYGSSTGLERKRTITNTSLSNNTIANFAMQLINNGQTEFNERNFQISLPPLQTLNVYKLSPTLGAVDGVQNPSYPRPLTNTFSRGVINLSHAQLLDLYNNDRFRDPSGNFAMDIYFKGSGWGQIQMYYQKVPGGQMTLARPTQILNGGAYISSNIIMGGDNKWMIARYTLPEVPYSLSYALDDFAMFTSYEGFFKTTQFDLIGDFSIMKESNGGTTELNKLLNRIYNYNKVDKTWNLGFRADGTPNSDSEMLKIHTIDNNKQEIVRKINPEETLSYRLTGNEFADIIKSAKNGIQKKKEEFKYITGYSLNDLPIFEFEYKKILKNYNFIILTANSEFNCPSGFIRRVVISTSYGPSKVCVKETNIENSSYKFTYNPFENKKAISGNPTNRPSDPFTFIDLYSSEYIKEHHRENEVKSNEINQEINGSSTGVQKVEGLLGKVAPNKDLEQCVNNLKINGFQFEEVRNSKDIEIKETKTNFLKNPIRIYTHIDENVISKALENKKEEYVSQLDAKLNDLRIYIKDGFEEETIRLVEDRLRDGLDYQDNITISIPSKVLEQTLSSEDVFDLSEKINNDTYNNQIFQNAPQNAIINPVDSWKEIMNEPNNILNHIYATKLYVYNMQDDTEHTYDILTHVITNKILTVDGNYIALKNKEGNGVVYKENGQYVSTSDINNILKEATHVGFVADDVDRNNYSINIIMNTNFQNEKDIIIGTATKKTDELCSKALYFDYKSDRYIREKLEAWDLLIDKGIHYLSDTTVTTPDASANSPYKHLYDTIVGSSLSSKINHRAQIARDVRQCDHVKITIKGIKCEPGGGMRILILKMMSGQDISGRDVINFAKSIANADDLIRPLNEQKTFEANGKTVTLDDLSSPIYSEAVRGVVIHQYLPEIRHFKDYTHNPICPNCTKLSFKNRSIVASEVGKVLQTLKVALNKKIAGLTDFNSYEKCRNDLHSKGYADISREIFNPKFIQTNPENLTQSDATAFTATYNKVNGSDEDKVTIHVKMTAGTSADKSDFCNNLLRPTKFYSTSNIINTTMERIDGLEKSIGAIVLNRFYDKTYKDVWGDPNIFQSEICSSINVNRVGGVQSTYSELMSCKNPIVPENGVDKQLIDIGIANLDSKYNPVTYPYSRGVIEFIDLNEMIQDNHTGSSQSMTGSLSLVQDIENMGDYNKYSEIKTDYYNCLKFKAEKKVIKNIDFKGNERLYEAYPNTYKYYSFKADVCRETDNTSNPPKYIKGEYVHDGCPVEKDKMLHARRCIDILYQNKIAASIANHTCADVETKDLFKTTEDKYDVNETLNDSLDKTVKGASKKDAQLKQGVKKNISKDGHITMKYSQSEASIKQLNITSSMSGMQAGSGRELGRNSNFDSGMNSLKRQNNNSKLSGSGRGKSVNVTGEKNKMNSSRANINSLSAKYNAPTTYETNDKGQSGNYMDRATQKVTGGSSIHEAPNEQEQLSEKVAKNGPNIKSSNSLNNELTNGSLKKNNYDLDCTDCGGWNTQITEQDIMDKKREMDSKSVLNETEKSSLINSVDVNGNEKDKDIIENPRGKDSFNASNKTFKNYYDYQDENKREAAGEIFSNTVKTEALDMTLDNYNNTGENKNKIIREQKLKLDNVYIKQHKQ